MDISQVEGTGSGRPHRRPGRSNVMEEKAKGMMKEAASSVTGEFVRKYVEKAIEEESS